MLRISQTQDEDDRDDEEKIGCRVKSSSSNTNLQLYAKKNTSRAKEENDNKVTDKFSAVRDGSPFRLQSDDASDFSEDYPALDNAEDEVDLPSTNVINANDTTTPMPAISDVMKDLQGTLSPQVSYFFLRQEVGLSEEAMMHIMFAAPSVLGMATANIRRKVQVLRQTMDLSDEQLRNILERHPGILHLSADKNLSPTILFLVRALDLSVAELRHLVVAQPSILGYARANLQQKIRFFTTGLLEYSVEECRQLWLAEPKLTTASVKEKLLPRIRFLTRELELPRDKLRKILKLNPRILLYSLEENLVPKLIHFCIMTLHMEPGKHITKLLTSYPQILDYNLERHILPITRYFVAELDVSAHEFRNMLIKSPRLMTCSLTKIKKVVGYLRYEIGLEAPQVKRVLYVAPQVLGLDVECNLASKIEIFQEIFGLYSRDQLCQVLAAMPTLLLMSVEQNLARKVEYLQQQLLLYHKNNHLSAPTGVWDVDCENSVKKQLLRDVILKLPPLLGYSLERRIQPRMERIVAAGLPPSSITIGIPMKGEAFDDWLQRRIQKKAKRAIVLSDTTMQQKACNDTSESNRSARIVYWTRRDSKL